MGEDKVQREIVRQGKARAGGDQELSESSVVGDKAIRLLWRCRRHLFEATVQVPLRVSVPVTEGLRVSLV